MFSNKDVLETIAMVEKEHLDIRTITLDKLEAMTCVCSVGLDMIAIPGALLVYG
jgi:uncharacterized protein (UPF0210 family)